MGSFEEVFENQFAFFAENGFGVELDTFDWVCSVADTHDFSVVYGYGGYFEALWHGFSFSG